MHLSVVVCPMYLIKKEWVYPKQLIISLITMRLVINGTDKYDFHFEPCSQAWFKWCTLFKCCLQLPTSVCTRLISDAASDLTQDACETVRGVLGIFTRKSINYCSWVNKLVVSCLEPWRQADSVQYTCSLIRELEGSLCSAINIVYLHKCLPMIPTHYI